jgi:cytochrome c
MVMIAAAGDFCMVKAWPMTANRTEKHMSRTTASFGLILSVLAVLSLPACSQKPSDEDVAATPAADTAATPPATAAAAPAGAPAADSVDTVAGVKFADFKGDAASGEKVFVACKTCHVVDMGVNRIGPSLHAIVGRTAGSVEGFKYSAANKGSGIVWSEAKLFQYLENPQRVVPGTIMTYQGVKDAQKRADLIAYLKTQG